MLAPSLASLLSAQVGLELSASAAYLQFAALAYSQGLKATSAWLLGNSEEEQKHARGVVQYLSQRGVVARVPAVEAPPVASDPAAMAAALLDLEERVTDALQAIHAGAEASGDGQTCTFILGYLREQTEGEDAARTFGRMVAGASDLGTLDGWVKAELG